MSNESHESSSPLPSRSERGAGGEGLRRCSRCGITKPLDAFHKDKTKKEGRRYYCKVCGCESRRAYYAAHPESEREYRRAYRAVNAEYYREYNAAYSVSHAEARREYSRARYARNAKAREYRRDYSRAYRAAHPGYDAAHRAANIEAHRAQEAAYRATYPEAHRAKAHRRRALKKGNGGDGFTTSQLKHMRATQGGECAYCMGLYHPHVLTIDHIIPLDQGGPHEAANIVLACPKCNFNKANRTPDQWINRWYYQKSE